MITHNQLREIFASNFKKLNHKFLQPTSLILQNDSTTLFTGFGMQQLVPYFRNNPHHLGKRLYNIQPCLRTNDIDEIGDNRHLTFFEMMGNWSLGDYFKEEQLEWYYLFLTKQLGLSRNKLSVTVFEGGEGVEKDELSASVWKKLGIPKEKVFYYGVDKNWWSRSGPPKSMPIGEIGGPDSEVFYEFDISHDKQFGQYCHPNCDCGKYIEIGNSVFIQYVKEKDGNLKEMSQKNVDFGGGIERTLMALQNKSDVFQTDIFSNIIEKLEAVSGKKYLDKKYQGSMRIIADHLKASVMLISEDLKPSNKEHGYVLRRLLRKSCVRMIDLDILIQKKLPELIKSISQTYDGIEVINMQSAYKLSADLGYEIDKFQNVINKVYKRLDNANVTSQLLFDLYQTYGLPLELSVEYLKKHKKDVGDSVLVEFEKLKSQHSKNSKTASKGMFTGGLADQSEQVVKYHTTTHLLHQALRDVLGYEIKQEGSNITQERLRFDFSFYKFITKDQIEKVESIINNKIKEALAVNFQTMPRSKAEKLGALSFFKEKYPETVKVYYIGETLKNAYSKEFCGGPHVTNISEIGQIKIIKLKKIGSAMYRIYAK